jgi:electron transfer flavoprotein alpha subunit
MIRSLLRPARSAFLSTSSAAQRRLASSLVFLEHKNGKLNDGSLSAVTAAKKLDGDAAGIVVGTKADVDGVLDEVKK